MKKLKFFVAGTALLFLVSCGAKEAADFNNKMVNSQKDLLTQINVIKAKGENQQTYKEIQDLIKNKIAELDAIKGPSDGADFKSAMRADFSSLGDDYDLEVKFFDPQLTEEEKTKLTTQVTEVVTKILANDQQVIKEQKKFASAHNVKLQ